MEKDIGGHCRGYDLTRGQYVQGLLARCRHGQLVDVVTVTLEREDALHERWPRILNS